MAFKNDTGTGSVGIEVNVDFNGESSLQNLKQELNSAMEELKDQKVNIDFSTTAVSKELDKLGTKFKETREQIDNSFKNINFEGVDRLVDSLKELGNVNGKLEVNVIKEMAEDAGLATEQMEALKTSTEEVGTSVAEANKQMKNTATTIKEVYNDEGELVKRTTEYGEANGQVLKVVQKIGEAVTTTTEKTIKAQTSAKELYAQYEKATQEVLKLSQAMEKAKEGGANKDVLASYKKQLELQEQIAENAKATIQEQGLYNEKLEQGTELRLKNLELQQKTSQAIKQQSVEEAKAQEKELANLEKISSKISELEAKMKTANALRQKLSKNSYSSEENRVNDENTLRSLDKSIGSSAGRLVNKDGYSSLAPIYDNYKSDKEYIERERQAKQLMEQQVAYEKKFETEVALVNKLYSERLALLKKINTDPANEQQHKVRINSIDDQIGGITSGYGLGSERISFNELEEAHNIDVAMMKATEDFKALNSEQKVFVQEYASGLKKIAQLQQQISKESSESASMKIQEQLDALIAKKEEMYSKLNADNQVNMNNLESELALTTEIVQIKQEELKTNNAIRLQEQEQTAFVKEYTSNLKEIEQLKKSIIKPTSEDAMSLTESRINKILATQDELYNKLSLDNQEIVDNLEKDLSFNTEIAKIKQQEIETNNQLKIQEQEQTAYYNRYMQTLQEEQAIRTEMSNSNFDERQMELETRLNSLLSEREAIYTNMNASSQSMVAFGEEQYLSDTRAVQKEQQLSAFLASQKQAYEEILALEEEKLRIESQMLTMSVTDPIGANRLRGQYINNSALLEAKRESLNTNGYYSEALEDKYYGKYLNSSALEEYNVAQQRAVAQMEASDERIVAYRNQLSSLSREYGLTATSTKEFKNALARLDAISKITDADLRMKFLDTMPEQFSRIDSAISRTDSKMEGLMSKWKDFAGYTAVSMATSGLLGSFSSAWDNIKKINDAYTELHKVYDPDEFGNGGWQSKNWIPLANQMGKEYSYSTASTLDALYQAVNYGFGNREQAQALARASLILSNTGKINEPDASKYLISIMKSFYGNDQPTGKASEQVVNGHTESLIQSIIDKMSQGGMYFPITSGGIAEAMMRGGTAIQAGGNTFEQGIKMIIAGNNSRQDPATVGNSMKSIVGSFVNLFTGTSKADARNKKQLLGLTGNIYTDGHGNLRSTYDILTSLSEMYSKGDFTPTQLQTIANLIGGKTQLGVVLSVIKTLLPTEQKFNQLNSSVNTQTYHSADKEEAKYMNSIQARLNSLKEGVNELWLSILKTNYVDAVLEFGVKIVSGLNFIISKVGVLTTVVGAFFAIMSLKDPLFISKFGTNRIKSFITMINKLRNAFGKSDWITLKGKPNDDVNNALKELELKQQQIAEGGLATGEEMMNNIAEGIRSNTAVEEAIEAKKAEIKASLVDIGGEHVNPVSNVGEIEETSSAVEELNNRITENTENLDENNIKKGENKEATLRQDGSIAENTRNTEENTNSKARNSDATGTNTTLIDDNTGALDINDTSLDTNDASLERNKRARESGATGFFGRRKITREAGAEVEEEAPESILSRATERIGGGLLTDGAGGLILDGVTGALTGGVGIAGIMALSYALPKIVSGISYEVNKFQHQAQQYSTDTTNTLQTSAKGVAQYSQEIKNLQDFEKSKSGQTLEQLNAQYQAGTLAQGQMQQYYDLMNQVAKIAPQTVDFKDANGNQFVDMSKGLAGVLAQMKELKKQEADLVISGEQVSKVWSTIHSLQGNIYKQRQNAIEQQDASKSLTVLHQQEDQKDNLNSESSYSVADTVTMLQGQQNQYNQAQSQNYKLEQANRAIQSYTMKYYVIPEIDQSAETSAFNSAQKTLMKSFMGNLNLSEVDKKSVDGIMQTVSSALTNPKTLKAVQAVSTEMGDIEKKYESGAMSYSQFVSEMGGEKQKLIKNIGLTPQEAEQVTNPAMWKKLENTQQQYVSTMSKTATSMGLNNKNLKANLQAQFSQIEDYMDSLTAKGANTPQGRAISTNLLKQIFSVSPDTYKALAKQIGLPIKDSMQQVVSTISNNPTLQKQFANALNSVMTGKPISPSTVKSLEDNINSAIIEANNYTKQQKNNIMLTVKVKPNSAEAKQCGLLDANTYSKSFTLNAKTVGQILNDPKVKTVSMQDGQMYVNGVKATAKQQGEIEHYVYAQSVGKQDGEKYSVSAMATAKAKGVIIANTTEAEQAGNSAGRAWYRALGNWISSGWSEITHLFTKAGNDSAEASQHANHAFQLFVIPHNINIEKSKNSVKSAFEEVHSFSNEMWKHYIYNPPKDSTVSSNRGGISGASSAKGGVSSGGKGGKGGAVSAGISATSFATVGVSTGNVGETMMATEVDSPSSFAVTPNSGIGGGNFSAYAQAGNDAGYSFYSAFSQIGSNILNEEATQYERLTQISQQYFDENDSDIKLNIDLNTKLQNSLKDIGTAISHNQALQSETENGYTTIDLLQQELELLNKKKQVNEALEQSYNSQLETMKNSLSQQGFTFSSNGSILNAVSKIQSLEKWVNDMPDKISKTVSKTSTKWVAVPYQYYKYQKGNVTEVPYSYTKYGKGTYQDVEYHYYNKEGKEITGTYKKWIAGTAQTIEGEYKKYGKGVKVAETGYKYQKEEVTTPKTELTSNPEKASAKAMVQNLQNLVQAYNNMMTQTLPQTESAIDQINQQVASVYNNMLQTASSVQSQITQIIEKQISERKQAIENEANAQVQALDKVQTKLEQTYSNQQYQQGLKQQYKSLQEIQEQINNAELDHSLNGQAQVAQLKKQYQQEQQAINQTISSHNEQVAQDKIQQQIKTIQSNAQQAQKNIDSTWTPQKIAETVQQAMLTGSFRDVAGNIVSVKKVWIEFANEFDNGLGVMGNKIKDDFIKQLQEAQKIMQNLKTINQQMGYYNTSDKTPDWVVPSQDTSLFAIAPVGFNHSQMRPVNNTSQVNFNAPLVHVNGSVGNASDLHKFTKDLEYKVTKEIVKTLRNQGAL